MLIGMALGVAVVFAVDIANESAKRAFSLSLDTVTGRTTHQIVAGANGLDETIYTKLRTELGIRQSAPLIQGDVNLLGVQTPGLSHSSESLQLLGVDIFAEPMFRNQVGRTNTDLDSLKLLKQGAVILADTTAQRLHAGIGDHLDVIDGGMQLELIATVSTELQPGFESIAMVDIATAQELLGLQGRLSRIDLILPLPPSIAENNPTIEETIRTIEAEFPGVSVSDAARRDGALSQMTEAFHTNLLAMSLLALLVGAFLIYNTVTLSVLQRRQTFGQLRALGIQRQQLFRSILTETLAFGLIGTLAGVLVGYFLGSLLLTLVTRTINDLYFTLDVSQVEFSTFTLIKALMIGLGVSLLSAVPPALEASNSNPGIVLQRSSVERRVSNLAPIIFLGGVLLLLVGVAILWVSNASLWAGFLAIFFIVAGYSLMIPKLLLILTKLADRRTGRSSTLGSYPVRSLSASLSRTSVAIAALAVSVSATAGVGIMIGSFRLSVDNWLVNTLQSDVYIRASSGGSIPEPVLGQLSALTNLSGTQTARMTEVETNTVPVRLMAVGFSGDTVASYQFNKRSNKVGATDQSMPTARQRMESLDNSDSVIISEPFANKSNLAVNDTLTLLTDVGAIRFAIAGIFTNYTTGKGLVVISMNTYRRYWQDAQISSIGLSFNNKDVAPEFDAISARLRSIVANESLSIRSNHEIRERSLLIFDQTFAITHVLRILTVGIAFVGILSALMALSLERRSEYAILRAVGLTPNELRKLLILQTGLMGLIAGLLALPLGIAMSKVLVGVINVRSFGWTMEYIVPSAVLLECLLLAVLAAILAGIYPAQKLSNLSPSEALRHQ